LRFSAVSSTKPCGCPRIVVPVAGTENGRHEPVFFCEADKPKKQHHNCVQVVVNGPRF
jgi:hypothetical protein